MTWQPLQSTEQWRDEEEDPGFEERMQSQSFIDLKLLLLHGFAGVVEAKKIATTEIGLGDGETVRRSLEQVG